MPATPTDKPRRGEEEQDREALKGAIRNRVLGTLGEPGRLGRVQVRPLGGNYYRVNILIAQGYGCARAAASYFRETDDEGILVRSTPELSRRGQVAVRTGTSRTATGRPHDV
jgi:hypothetical protein